MLSNHAIDTPWSRPIETNPVSTHSTWSKLKIDSEQVLREYVKHIGMHYTLHAQLILNIWSHVTIMCPHIKYCVTM